MSIESASMSAMACWRQGDPVEALAGRQPSELQRLSSVGRALNLHTRKVHVLSAYSAHGHAATIPDRSRQNAPIHKHGTY